MRGRHDLAQHFFLSAYLAIIVGEVGAEAAGLMKEVSDSQSGSGFSYVDLEADLAGIAFGRRVLKGEVSLLKLRSFVANDYMPEISGLPEGLTWKEVRPQLQGGGTSQLASYRKEIAQRIDRLSSSRKAKVAPNH